MVYFPLMLRTILGSLRRPGTFHRLVEISALKAHFSTEILKNGALARKYPQLRLFDGQNGRPQEAPRASREILSELPLQHDLVLVDARQDPPLVRYQSHSELYKLTQKREEAATRARLANRLKEMHFSTVTGEHDFQVKLGRVEEWVRKGWRVKVLIEEKRGAIRRSSKANNALFQAPIDPKRQLMTDIISKLNGIAEITGSPEQERGNLLFHLQGTQKIMSEVKQQRSVKK